MDAELEFAIQPNTTGKQLFDQVGETSNSWRDLVLYAVFPMKGTNVSIKHDLEAEILNDFLICVSFCVSYNIWP